VKGPQRDTDLRLAAVRRAMRKQSLGRFLVTSREHVRYLSNFSGSSGWLIIGPRERLLLTDFRYRDQAGEEAPHWSLHLAQAGLPAAVGELATAWDHRRVGYESAHLTVRDFQLLAESDGGSPPPVEWIPTERLVEGIALIKDEGEIGAIAAAAAIADLVYAEVVSLIRPGVTEREIAVEIECRTRRRGGEGTAFPPIVASGLRAALPHAGPTDRRIAEGDMVIIDMGVVVRGYRSDLTRTVAVGSASERLREIYRIVAEAQAAAVDMVHPGIDGVELDAVARRIITEHGYGEAFGHNLGHGVGLRVHEGPSLSWRSTDVLAPGMVVTIEPGIYLPGWGGVRIEDLVVVTRHGRHVLSTAPKDLQVV